jgi:hypothetical protein
VCSRLSLGKAQRHTLGVPHLLCRGFQAMKVSINVTLPDTLSWDEERLIAANGYGREMVFKRIVICPSRPLKKVMGFHPATTLHISWDSSIGRNEARSDFREYLLSRAVPPDLKKRCEVLFDNADAIDEEGTLIT